MSIDVPEAPELPDLPAFDQHAMRRAVRRGVMRTAFVGAVWIVLSSIVLSVCGQAALVGLGRRDHLQHVVAVGWQVAHPDFIIGMSSDRNGIVHTTSTYDAQPLVAQSVPNSKLSFTESLFGGLSRSYPEPATPASGLLSYFEDDQRTDWKTTERTMLHQLPQPVRVSAIVQFAHPLSYPDVLAFATRYSEEVRVQDAPLLLNSAGDISTHTEDSHPLTGICSWSWTYDFRLTHAAFNRDDPISGFRSWVHSLHDSDRGALAQVGVSLTKLRDVAREGLVHGFIVDSTTTDVLLKMLNDPSVAAVHPYDVAFALEGS
jgi:hypothetical protein